MSASGAYDDRAAVGRRIGQARRELGLTQGELATRIGVTLGILDRYETGKADPSEKLAQIAEITARDVSWFTSTAQYEIESAEYAAELPAELGRRIAESRDLRGPTRQGLPEERIATLGEPGSWPETGDPSAHRPDLADGSGEEPAALARRLDELQAALADEHRKHGDAVAKSARVQEDLERVTVDRQALADLLEQSRSELAGVRTQSEQLAQQVSALEMEVRAADQRSTEAADRLGQATTELERRRDHERSLAEQLDLRQLELSVRSAELDRRETAVVDSETEFERRREHAKELELRQAELSNQSAELDRRETAAADAETEFDRRREHERSLAKELELRQAELGNRSAELDRRETAVADAEKSVEDGRRALGDLELRASAVERREEAVRLREGELEHRAGMLADLARRLEELKSTAVDVGRPPRQDQHLLILANHGYRLVARWGAAPDPGELVDLEDGRFRCLRISASPFLGDDRLCAVLEPLTAASET
jgi:DNA-binding XRE family transcriptional regulator